jgi:hypothetical protein
MEISNASNYSPPVDQLLTYGDPRLLNVKGWPDYLALGFGPEHIPDLIRLAIDAELNNADPDSLEVWAPLHAWRALGQLRAESAVEPLLSLFGILEDDEGYDWVMTELPEVFGLIGPAALPILTAYIADPSHGRRERWTAIDGIKEIADLWPNALAECVAFLMEQLERMVQLEQPTEDDVDVTTATMMALVNLHATEAAPLIERAFAANRIDPMMMGDWLEVQVMLGLKTAEEVESIRAARYAQSRSFSRFDSKGDAQRGVWPSSNKTSHKNPYDHKKAKSKMVKQSKKKNRKR